MSKVKDAMCIEYGEFDVCVKTSVDDFVSVGICKNKLTFIAVFIKFIEEQCCNFFCTAALHNGHHVHRLLLIV